jgi:hypothetical protein
MRMWCQPFESLNFSQIVHLNFQTDEKDFESIHWISAVHQKVRTNEKDDLTC